MTPLLAVGPTRNTSHLHALFFLTHSFSPPLQGLAGLICAIATIGSTNGLTGALVAVLALGSCGVASLGVTIARAPRRARSRSALYVSLSIATLAFAWHVAGHASTVARADCSFARLHAHLDRIEKGTKELEEHARLVEHDFKIRLVRGRAAYMRVSGRGVKGVIVTCAIRNACACAGTREQVGHVQHVSTCDM